MRLTGGHTAAVGASGKQSIARCICARRPLGPLRTAPQDRTAPTQQDGGLGPQNASETALFSSSDPATAGSWDLDADSVSGSRTAAAAPGGGDSSVEDSLLGTFDASSALSSSEAEAEENPYRPEDALRWAGGRGASPSHVSLLVASGRPVPRACWSPALACRTAAAPRARSASP
jgi:hypothetical protein